MQQQNDERRVFRRSNIPYLRSGPNPTVKEALSKLAHPVQRIHKIVTQIFHILQPDIQPHDPVPVIRTILISMQIVRDREARHPRPAVANFE